MEETAILQEILEHPDDDVPRLIYADWLEDHGGPMEQARAEFIRLQIQLSRMPGDDERRPELEALERRMRKRHERQWLGELREAIQGWTFVRGFISHLALEAGQLLKIHPLLLRRHPVHSLRLTSAREGGVLARLGQLPFLLQVLSLDLSNNYLDQTQVEPLVDSPYLRNLRTLRFNDNPYGYDAVRALTESMELSSLRVLELRRNNLTDVNARMLAESDALIELMQLDLRGNAIGEPARNYLRSMFRDGVRF